MMWNHLSDFSARNVASARKVLAFVRLQTLVLSCLCNLAFCKFHCAFYENTFESMFIVGMFYFILV